MAVEYVPISEQEGTDPVEIPTEPDGSLPLSTLTAQFPTACGIRYRSPDTGALRAVRVVDGVLQRPPELHSWCHNGNVIYLCTFGKDNKRKGDDSEEEGKAKRRRPTDLIVLGLPYKVTEEDLKEHFGRFGEVAMSQIKRDQQGNSRGYGFIRFAEFDAQIDCLSCPRHQLRGRWCEVKVPLSQGAEAAGSSHQQQQNSRRIFVGRVTEELTADILKEFFGKYGTVDEVFIPKPFRSFAFITFAESGIAESLINEDFVIEGNSVHVGTANPKPQPQQQPSGMMMMRGNRMMMNSGFGGNQQSFYNNNNNGMGIGMGGGGGGGGMRGRGWLPQQQQQQQQQQQPYQNVVQALASNPQVLAAALAQMTSLGGGGGGAGGVGGGGGGGGRQMRGGGY